MKDPGVKSARSPWAKSAAKPLVNPGPHDLVTFTDAVGFIVEQLAPSPEDKRIEGDKVRHRLRTALKRGELQQHDNGKVQFGDLIAWGRRYPEWHTALAPFPSLNPGGGDVSFAQMQACGRGTAIPSNAAEMEAALRAANRRVYELEDAIKEKDEELTRLRPLEIQARHKVADAKRFGAMGGRPRKR